MPKIPSAVKEAIQSRIVEVKKELEVLKASPLSGDESFDRMKAEMKSLQNINNAAGKKLPVRELLSNNQVVAAITISIAIAFSVGLLAAKSFAFFSSYDECILKNIQAGMSDYAAAMIEQSCLNRYSKTN